MHVHYCDLSYYLIWAHVKYSPYPTFVVLLNLKCGLFIVGHLLRLNFLPIHLKQALLSFVLKLWAYVTQRTFLHYLGQLWIICCLISKWLWHEQSRIRSLRLALGCLIAPPTSTSSAPASPSSCTRRFAQLKAVVVSLQRLFPVQPSLPWRDPPWVSLDWWTKTLGQRAGQIPFFNR